MTTMTNSCSCCADMLHGQFSRRRFLHVSGAAGLAAGLAAAIPGFALAATGKYEAMLLTCIDPRFPAPTMSYMKNRHLVGQYSQFSIAGAAIGVVAPAFKDWSKTFWDNLGASIQLHNISKVIVVDHRDCGAAKIAYGADKVATPAIETQTHKEAMLEFRKQLGERQPAMKSELGLMALNGKIEMFS